MARSGKQHGSRSFGQCRREPLVRSEVSEERPIVQSRDRYGECRRLIRVRTEQRGVHSPGCEALCDPCVAVASSDTEERSCGSERREAAGGNCRPATDLAAKLLCESL